MGFDVMWRTRLRSTWHKALAIGAEHRNGEFDFR